MTRRYIPTVGSRVKLQLSNDHTKLQLEQQSSEPHLWSWFKVLEVLAGRGHYAPRIKLQLLNGTKPMPQIYEVAANVIAPPIGWKPVYTIYCVSLEQAEKVRDSWFTRGIHVWASHDLFSAGRMAFTPFSEEESGTAHSPHWRYTGNPCESVPPGQCPKVFNVVHLEQWEPQLSSDPKAKKIELAALRAEPGVTVEYHRREMYWSAERETVVYTAAPWKG